MKSREIQQIFLISIIDCIHQRNQIDEHLAENKQTNFFSEP